MRLHPNTSVCFSRLLGFLAVALVFFAGLAAHASTVGTFNISGNVTITGSSFSTVDWASNQATTSGELAFTQACPAT